MCPAIPKEHENENKIDTEGHKKEKGKVDQELDDLVSVISSICQCPPTLRPSDCEIV